MSALQEKYQSLTDMAGSYGLTAEEGEGFIRITGALNSADDKKALWEEWNRLDPDYRSGEVVIDVSAPEGTVYTVQSGDSLTKIGSHHGVSWQAIYEANKDLIGDNPDVIHPGQQLTIPSA
jgi:nucleoid-associated protein YgaU